MTDLGVEERNLLAVLAEADEPTVADRERVRALVLQRVATATGLVAATYIAGSATAAGGAAASTSAAASGAAAVPAALGSSAVASSGAVASGAAAVATTAAVTWKSAIAVKVAAAVLGVGVASGAGWYAVQSQTNGAQTNGAPAAAPQVTTPAVVAAPAAQVPAIVAAQPTEVVEAPKPAEAPAVVHRAAAAEAKPDHLNDEAELLKRVQRAINSGDTGAALSLLQQHATTYPTGVLVQERIGLRAITLCRAGQHDQGVTEATRFLKGNPSSPLAERVKSACELRP